ncbi:hypothetical protein ACFQ51_18455 [Streptomyces kaempferi]
MKLARYTPPTAAALLLGLTTVIGPGAVDSYAVSGVPLPIAHFAHIVVDAPHGHLFISGGAGDGRHSRHRPRRREPDDDQW